MFFIFFKNVLFLENWNIELYLIYINNIQKKIYSITVPILTKAENINNSIIANNTWEKNEQIYNKNHLKLLKGQKLNEDNHY